MAQNDLISALMAYGSQPQGIGAAAAGASKGIVEGHKMRLEKQAAIRQGVKDALEKDLTEQQIEKIKLETDLLKKTGGITPTDAKKRTDELKAQGVDPFIAQGIGYNTFREVTDPSTGDIIQYDLRTNKRLNPEESALLTSVAEQTGSSIPKVEESIPDDVSDSQLGNRVIAKGTKQQEIQEKKQEKLDTKVKDLSEAITKSEIPRQQELFNEVETLMEKYKDDLPHITAMVTKPDWMLSDDGRKLKQAIQALGNITLKDRSGAAVTSQELERFQSEFGKGAFFTDEKALRSGLEQLKSTFEAHKKAILGGYDDEVVEKFEEQSGLKLRTTKDKDKEEKEAKQANEPQKNKPTGRFDPDTGKIVYY